MTEKLQALILDPHEVAIVSRSELSLSGELDGIEVFHEGLDFGDEEVKAFLAEGVFGSRPIDHIWPLRTIKIPLTIRATETLSFDQVRSGLEAKVSQINTDGGGWLKRVLPSGKHSFADLVGAKLHLSADWLTENREIDKAATLELEALPDLYGDPIEGPLHVFTGDGDFTESILGTMPARVEQLIVTAISPHNQSGLIWDFRGRDYDSAETSKWAYNAEELELLEETEKTTIAGSYGTKVVTHGNLSTEWTPVLGTTFGSALLSHVGVYDVWVRVYSSSAKLPWLRLLWDLGDLISPSENQQIQIPNRENFYLLYLGQINLQTLPFGDQRWKGVIYGRGDEGGENVSIDRLWFQNTDESAGVLRASTSSVALPAIKASDLLVGAGALTGSSAQRGGKWEKAAGSEPDFERSEEGAERKTKSDSTGRTEVLSESTIGPCTVRCVVQNETLTQHDKMAVYLRYCDSTHWIRITVIMLETGPGGFFEYRAGEFIREAFVRELPTSPKEWTLSGSIDANAQVIVTSPFTWVENLPAIFATGGANAEGKVGIFDSNQGSVENVRYFSQLIVSPLPSPDAVIYGTRSAQLSEKGMYRQAADGEGVGLISIPGADLPRLPVPNGPESTVEISLKPTRGDTLLLPDSGIDNFSAQLTYRPCWAEIPS